MISQPTLPRSANSAGSGPRVGESHMPVSEKLKTLIRSAWDDGAPCLVATQGLNGPNISPKGSMVVFDDDHLAYWERSKKQALENLGHDKRVCVIYANFKAQRDGVLELGLFAILRNGRTARERAGPRRHIRSAVAARTNPCRRRHRHRRVGQDRARRRCSGQDTALKSHVASAARMEPTGPARSCRPDDRLREIRNLTHPRFDLRRLRNWNLIRHKS